MSTCRGEKDKTILVTATIFNVVGARRLGASRRLAVFRLLVVGDGADEAVPSSNRRGKSLDSDTVETGTEQELSLGESGTGPCLLRINHTTLTQLAHTTPDTPPTHRDSHSSQQSPPIIDIELVASTVGVSDLEDDRAGSVDLEAVRGKVAGVAKEEFGPVGVGGAEVMVVKAGVAGLVDLAYGQDGGSKSE